MGATDHDQLLKQRGAEYGESWRMTDRWIQENTELLAAAPSPFTLIMMHNKLMRALTSPSKEDHYDDIIGYAKLAKQALVADEPVNHWLVLREEEDRRKSTYLDKAGVDQLNQREQP